MIVSTFGGNGSAASAFPASASDAAPPKTFIAARRSKPDWRSVVIVSSSSVIEFVLVRGRELRRDDLGSSSLRGGDHVTPLPGPAGPAMFKHEASVWERRCRHIVIRPRTRRAAT